MIARTSSPLDTMRDRYDVVVVGSGYGGAIAASRLARAGRSVCLLERGREILPGEYPDTPAEARREFQADSWAGRVGSRTALFDLRNNAEMNVVVGCGLGGTSLINANVALRAEPRVFDDPRWPRAIRDDVDGLLAESYVRAEAMLRPVPYPSDLPPLRKLAALERSAAALHAPFYRPPINVTFQDGVNHVGVEQRACVLCGDCVSGCNYGAKNTLLMNYLPDAGAYGAAIYTQTSVRRVERAEGAWRVHFQALATGREPLDAPTRSVAADVVVLAAGALGSTEILLRSRDAGLPLSDRLGEAFTGNGDVLGFAYNGEVEVNSIGFGANLADGREPVGPCIAGIIDLRDDPVLEQGIVVEEGVIPGAIAALMPAAFTTAARFVGKDTDEGVADLVAEMNRELESLVQGPYRGALRNTQVYLVMAHDDGRGRMYLRDDRLRIDWPGVGKQEVFARVDEQLLASTQALGGTYLRNPTWTRLLGQDLVTVHPLGGCALADDASTGVVDERGRVFAGRSGTAIHPGLYVSDGAVIPRPLGVNPLLTISAITERCMALVAADRGWQIDYRFGQRLPRRPPPAAPRQRVGLRLSERMDGYFSTDVSLDFEDAARVGKRQGTPFELQLRVVADDVESLVGAGTHQARLEGTVTLPALSAHPLTVEDGVFTLMEPDPARPGVRETRYRARLRGDGVARALEGFKLIRDDRGFDSWADVTTVFVSILEGDEPDAPVVAKGIARMSAREFTRSLRSIEVTNARSARERLDTVTRFGSASIGPMFATYGPAFRWPTRVKPDAPPRKRRELRAPAPVTHAIEASDGAPLLLTRYRGGGHGPVLAAHGLGLSAGVFEADTLDTSLVEYLVANGFDAWLFDWRASWRLPGSRGAFTLDDAARRDWPAAVDTVRQATGADAVDALAHGTGALALLMGLLDGLEGIRSAVGLEAGLHVVVAPDSPLRERRHMREAADGAADSLPALWERVARLAGRGLAERCPDPVCRRITSMYGPMYEHDRLGAATHAALHELFAVTSPTLFDHLATIATAGRLVDSTGADEYVPNAHRFAVPLTLIHGAADRVFSPEGADRTLELLRSTNGEELVRGHSVSGYGHADVLIGRDAVTDVYPLILDHLQRAEQR